MAINVSPINISGLANLAGQGVPNLNLQNYGNTAVPNQALFLAQNEQMKLQQQMAEAQMRQQTALFEQQQSNSRNDKTVNASLFNTQTNADARLSDAQMRSQQQVLDRQQRSDAAQGTLDVNKAQLGINQQNADQSGAYQQQLISNQQLEQHHKEQIDNLNQMLKIKQDDRNQLGAIGAGFLYQAQRTQDPKQLEAAKNQTISQLEASGTMSSAQIDQLKKMPVDQFKQVVVSQMGMMEHANMIDQTKPNISEQGGQLVAGMDENGNPTVSIAMPKKAKEDAFETVQQYRPIQAQLTSWIKSWTPVYDQYKTEMKGIIGNIEGKLGIGGSYSDPKFIKNFSEARSKLSALVVNLASTLKNSRSPLIQEQLRKMMPEETDSPEAVEGKQAALQDFVNNHLNEANDTLQAGTIDITNHSTEPDKYQGEVSNTSEPKMIRVIQNSSGQVGQIPESEYNDKEYKKI